MHDICHGRIAWQGALECGVVEQAAVRLQHQQLWVGALHNVREVPACKHTCTRSAAAHHEHEQEGICHVRLGRSTDMYATCDFEQPHCGGSRVTGGQRTRCRTAASCGSRRSRPVCARPPGRRPQPCTLSTPCLRKQVHVAIRSCNCYRHSTSAVVPIKITSQRAGGPEGVMLWRLTTCR